MGGMALASERGSNEHDSTSQGEPDALSESALDDVSGGGSGLDYDEIMRNVAVQQQPGTPSSHLWP